MHHYFWQPHLLLVSFLKFAPSAVGVVIQPTLRFSFPLFIIFINGLQVFLFLKIQVIFKTGVLLIHPHAAAEYRILLFFFLSILLDALCTNYIC